MKFIVKFIISICEKTKFIVKFIISINCVYYSHHF